MSTRQRVVFDSWSKGDYGRGSPTVPGTFSGTNVSTYPLGAIGPRAALAPVSVTGLPASPVDYMQYIPGAALHGEPPSVYTFHDNRNVYKHDSQYVDSNNSTPPAASLMGTTENPVNDVTLAADGVFTCSITGSGSKIVAGSVTTVSAMPAGRRITHYKDSLVLSETAGSSRIRWSAPANGTSWPAANFLDIGDGEYIAGIYAQRDFLTILTRSGTVWTVSGALTSNATLRRIDQGPRAQFPGRINVADGVSREGVLRWLSDDKRRLGVFTGGQVNTVLCPTLPGSTLHTLRPDFLSYAAPVIGSDYILGGGAYNSTGAGVQLFFWLYQDGAWTRHIPGITWSGSDPTPTLVATELQPGVVLFAHRQPSATTFYRADFTLDSPLDSEATTGGAVGPLRNTEGSTGLPVTGEFTTHEWWTPSGEEAHVKALIMEVEYDVHLADTTNTKFSVSVESLNRWDQDGAASSAAQSWVPAGLPKSAPAGGYATARQRAVFRFGDQPRGAGFRVKVAGMRGVMIHRIIAIVDVDDQMRF